MNGVAPAIEILDHTRAITGIDPDGTQVKQGAIALFALAQRSIRMLPPGDVFDGQKDQVGTIAASSGVSPSHASSVIASRSES